MLLPPSQIRNNCLNVFIPSFIVPPGCANVEVKGVFNGVRALDVATRTSLSRSRADSSSEHGELFQPALHMFALHTLRRGCDRVTWFKRVDTLTCNGHLLTEGC